MRLRLARGRVDAAEAAIRRAVGEAGDRATRSRLLEATETSVVPMMTVPSRMLARLVDTDHGRNAVLVRAREEFDRPAVERFLAERHSAPRIARRGEVLYPLDHPALLTEADGALTGVLTYVIRANHCEVLTVHTSPQWSGAGTALIIEVRRIAAERGCTRLWVVTTNDNVDALRFYQRRGFRLTELRVGAIDDARTRLKPEIPKIGAHGIPLRDELELDQPLTATRARRHR